ncbi:MAG TPA: M20/M25/M40 family metallo-hydrolase [Nitrososphaeraceae archaeon]|nr:M20/M25/M40 family metallo-hydrolase [Nitrososphaeraceae archaeon]
MVSPTYAIELLKRSLEEYTPSKAEAPLANLVKDKSINELGFEQANIDNVGNVIATKGSGRPIILLCGHMDTVPGRVPIRIRNGYLYGRGASDAKGSLIAMLLAASEFPKQRGSIIFAGVVDEEGNATGIKELVRSKSTIDYAIFGEPSGINNITIAYKGRFAFRLTCDVGSSAHASAPWLAKNSIEEVYDFWQAIQSEIGRVESGKDRSGRITCSLTEISGGSSHNVTPQKCKITVDIRIPTTNTSKMIHNLVASVIKDVAIKKNVHATYRIEDMTEPFEADHTSPLVRALSLSILDVCKKRPILLRKTGTGDMNILGNAFKIPVVTYGPGDPHSSHTIDERISISEYISSIDVFTRALFHTSRLHHLRSNKINVDYNK